MLAPIPFDSDKLAVLQSLAPRVIDPRNTCLVGDPFTFGSSRERAALFA